MKQITQQARVLCFAAVVLAAGVIEGCRARAVDDASITERNLLLSTTAQESSDTLVRVLVAREREFLRVVGTSNSGELAGYLDMRFVWNPDPNTATVGYLPQGDADYFAMLAGYRPPVLAGMPEAFAVYPNGEYAAQVFAELPGGHGGVLMTWEFRSGAWRAIRASDSDFNLVGWRKWLSEVRKRPR